MADKGHTILISEYDMPDSFECIWSKKLTNAMNPTITKNAVEKLFIPKSSKDTISQKEPEIDFKENELTSSFNDMMNRMDNINKENTEDEL